MVDILVLPTELRQIANQLLTGANKVGTSMQSIDNDILSLKGDKFLGNRANAVQMNYAPKRDALLTAKNIVSNFSVDLKTAADRFENADRGQVLGAFISSGGSELATIFSPVASLFTAVSVTNLISEIPLWLKDAIARLFPSPAIVSPLPKTPAQTLLTNPPIPAAQTPTASPSATPVSDPSKGYTVYYDIPPKSQGSDFGNAACVPTCIAMVLDYYHSKNSASKTATEAQLESWLSSDGTYGKGYRPDEKYLNQDLSQNLGYTFHVQQNSNWDDLTAKLKMDPPLLMFSAGLKVTRVNPGLISRALELTITH